MIDYTLVAKAEVATWKKKMTKRTGILGRVSKNTQTKINHLIPEKVHIVMTEGIKNMVKATLVGSKWTSKKPSQKLLGLYARDELFKEKLATYRKTAVIEGAGTGAGGILLGLADFPLLLSIKMKFLFEAAAIYGFDTNDYAERVFILHIFQVAFSSEETRRQTLAIIENWEDHKLEIIDMDWREFQQEYRDYIDLVKLFQLIPGFGAVIGAFANYNLLDQLGDAAINSYRIRYLQTIKEV